jgi:hypothetical protein
MANELCVLYRELDGLFLGIFDDAPKQRRCRVIRVNDSLFSACIVYGPSDRVPPRGCQDLEDVDIMGFVVQAFKLERNRIQPIHTSSGVLFQVACTLHLL